MSSRERIRHLIGVPSYRIRIGFFFMLGAMLIFGASLISDPSWEDILIDFAVVFIAVGLVSILWDFLGGDPTELRTAEALAILDERLNGIDKHLTDMSTVVDGKIGIERIWPTRREWEVDPDDGLAKWKDRVCVARNVDIVSNTLWGWFTDLDFLERLFESVERGAKVRILIYDPEAEVMRARAVDEIDPKGQMHVEILSTLERLARNRKLLEKDVRKNLKVRLTVSAYHLAQIVRADNLCLVATYLSGKSGAYAPTFQLRGTSTPFFSTYQDQIEFLWERGREVTDDEFTGY